MPAWICFLGLVALLPVAAELSLTLALWRVPRIGHVIAPALVRYSEWRAVVIEHWILAIVLAVLGILALVLALRHAILWWHNVVVPKITGAKLESHDPTFPKLTFTLMSELARTPKGMYFVGLDRKRQPVYLSEQDLDWHGHIMGHTGSGKTKSVLEPLMWQDMKAGKGVLYQDAKGSSENVQMFKNLAVMTERAKDLHVFALAYPDWSQSYNPLYLRDDDDPLSAAERVFSVFQFSHDYYKGQSKQLFYNLVRLMAATGQVFNLTDVRIAVADEDAQDYLLNLPCPARPEDGRAAKYEITQQLRALGPKIHETFTGLYNALAEYEHPLLNSYDPDIIIEDIMNERGLVYFNLPANRYPLLAPAIGKIVLQHVKAVSALRQLDRAKYDQTPFSVNIDEFSNFVSDEIVSALNKSRDAHVQFRLAHQSLGDLEQVSPVFARQVADNTRWKIALFENDAEHLEKVARSYGTRTTSKKTIRFGAGPFMTLLNMGEVSNREVEEFVLHPNALKSLAPQGQGYLLLSDRTEGLSFATLPSMVPAKVTLTRNSDKKPPTEGLGLYKKFVTDAPIKPLKRTPVKGEDG